jgi:hypothetical protein
VKAIETVYGGYRFRSRIEARWAVFFTRLGLEWEYEEQGYQLDSQRRYLPDFLLPELGLFIEIKPLNAFLIDPDGVKRWEYFAREVADRGRHERSVPSLYPGVRAEVAMICGPIPNPDRVSPCGPPPAEMPYQQGVNILDDWNWAWCACPSGKHFDIQFSALGNRIACRCKKPSGDAPAGNHPRIVNAYAAARAARFDNRGC